GEGLAGGLAGALRDRDRRILDDAVRAVAVFERRHIDERLERGAGLPLRLRRAVELALLERPAADHSENAPGLWIHDDEAAADIGDLAQRILRRWRRPTALGSRACGADRIDEHYIARLQDVRHSADTRAESLVIKRLARPAQIVDRDAPLPAFLQRDMRGARLDRRHR